MKLLLPASQHNRVPSLSLSSSFFTDSYCETDLVQCDLSRIMSYAYDGHCIIC